MKINHIKIDNFKSLNNFIIEKPNPFTVFVGANGVGKSNIFEALEFLNYKITFPFSKSDEMFGGYKDFANFKRYSDQLYFEVKYINDLPSQLYIKPYEGGKSIIVNSNNNTNNLNIGLTLDGNDPVMFTEGLFNTNSSNKLIEPKKSLYNQFIEQFSRIFINAPKKKINTDSDNRLSFDCSNLEKVLKRILSDDNNKDEISDWLNLFIPEFKNIEIKSEELSGTDALLFYEKNDDKPFTKKLISDGTFNILCLLTAVYQTDTPQFLCLEEPENGLNPYVIKELVKFFREQCKEKGHYIWLNTHSQTLVSQLQPEEIIVINKENGNTVAKQFKGRDMHGMSMDFAWMSNSLGGGIPW